MILGLGSLGWSQLAPLRVQSGHVVAKVSQKAHEPQRADAPKLVVALGAVDLRNTGSASSGSASAAAGATPAPAPVKRPVVPLITKLLGTAIEGDRAYAILLNGRQETKLRRAGDFIDGARLLEVTTDQVVLDHEGTTVTLAVPKELTALR